MDLTLAGHALRRHAAHDTRGHPDVLVSLLDVGNRLADTWPEHAHDDEGRRLAAAAFLDAWTALLLTGAGTVDLAGAVDARVHSWGLAGDGPSAEYRWRVLCAHLDDLAAAGPPTGSTCLRPDCPDGEPGGHWHPGAGAGRFDEQAEPDLELAVRRPAEHPDHDPAA